MTTAGRIDRAAALELLTTTPLARLLAAADAARRARHGRRTFHTRSLNLNPTNVCANRCALCAWWREPGDAEAYFLDLDAARLRLESARELAPVELHVVGGLDPRCDLVYHERLFALIRAILPDVFIQGPTATEIHRFATESGLTIAATLERLRAAGLGAIPGGGAEIFAPATRARICRDKLTADEWFEVHAAAHELGIPTNATMLFGHFETPEDIVDHLDRLRALQDRTRGFRAFIPLPFHPAGTRLGIGEGPTGVEIARVAALARIFLDNFEHLRLLVNYADRRLVGLLLHAGVDDLGGTSFDERIAAAAGAPADQRFTSAEEMADFIVRHDLEPCFVNSAYEPVGDGAQRANNGILTSRYSSFPRKRESNLGRGGFETRPCSSGLDSRLRGNDVRNIEPKQPSGHNDGNRLARVLARAAAGERLERDEALLVAAEAETHTLGGLAHARRCRRRPADRVTFVIDRNLSITNICEAECRFCAFHVPVGAAAGWALSIEEALARSRAAAAAGATQVLIQGGLNPALDLAFFERLFAAITAEIGITIHSLSPAEILFLAKNAGVPVEEALRRLRAAGLASLPGGGAEILVDDVRRQVSPRKIPAADWLAVMRAAHRLGMKSTATMVFGLGETVAQRVEHLLKLRALQDETGGFTAFIPWSFQSGRTRHDRPPTTGVDYLRIIALARLLLDNVAHLQAGWVTEGPDLAQLALHYGADDFGGILMEERVLAATGLAAAIDAERVIRLIRRAGFRPAQRNMEYEEIAK